MASPQEVADTAARQYAATTANLDARIALHARYSVGATPWSRWLFDRFDLRGGERHMIELHELLVQVGVDYQPARTHLPFTLENGVDTVRQVFDDVAVYTFTDALHVTDAEPLVDYLMSLAVVEESRHDGVRRVVETTLERQGAIDITKSSGAIIATVPGRDG